MKIRHILLLLSILLIGGIFQVKAQQGIGSWKVYSSFNGVQQIVTTKDKVYYLSSGQLYSYDKENDETYNYSTGSKLSDTDITKIFFDYEKDNLMVIYGNANIDLIDKDDKVYNMPDIKDAELNVVPSVNQVTFSGSKAYIVTNFGCVVYDLNKKEVISAGDYGMEMKACAVWDGYLIIIDGSGASYYIEKDESVASIGRFKKGFGFYSSQILALSDTILTGVGGSYTHIMTLEKVKGKEPNPENTRVKNLLENLPTISPMYVTDNDVAYTYSHNTLYSVDSEGNLKQQSLSGTPLQAARYGSGYEEKRLSSYVGNKEIWMGNRDGIGCYSLDETGKVTEKSAPFIPYGLTLAKIGRLSTSPSGKIYVSSYGVGLSKKIFNDETNYPFYINIIDINGRIKDITPNEFTIKNNNNQSLKVQPFVFKSGAHVMEDPDDPEAYYVGSGWDGLYRFKNGKETHHYYEDNSTMRCVANGQSLRIYGYDIDKYGNLWISQFALLNDPRLHMLSNENRLKENTSINDWHLLANSDKETGYETQVLACTNRDVIIIRDSVFEGYIIIIKTHGTTTTADDEILYVDDFIDQDGKSIDYTRIMHLIEDQNGKVWVGTDNGIFEISDPESASGNSIRVNHLKVPRNDGTNFADYLLNGEVIYWMAVDPANRKWIATQNSGLYLVSAAGDEILEHFDKTNSPLSSNLVTSVTCGTDNTVYVGTENGLLSYKSDASPAKDDFSEVYAYPNPVRPEYTGWITVTGLMDNSLVKIADAAGNVFFQGTSEGGMITWDGCDRSGNRVKTGVYYVFASSGMSGEASNGAVTKILVVN